MIVVEYVAPVFSHSGFGEAARLYIRALRSVGAEVTVAAMRYEGTDPDPSWAWLNPLVGRTDVTPTHRIVHQNPAAGAGYAKMFREEFHGPTVLLTAWETTKLHPCCVENLRCPDFSEIWVPTEWNRGVFRDSGINPERIAVIPHPYDPADYILPDGWTGDQDEKYNFYWIGHWCPRKNPIGALVAYYHAFPSTDHPVRLTMKTNGVAGVELAIRAVKQQMALDSYPEVLLANDPAWTRAQINDLHMHGNCCIALSRGEGWNLPAFEAAAWGNAVVASAWGGHEGWLHTRDGGERLLGLYPVLAFTTPCLTDSHASLHTGEQRWAEPALDTASRCMRELAKRRPLKRLPVWHPPTPTFPHLTMEVVGAEMLQRLAALS